MSIVFGFQPYPIEVLVARGSRFTSAVLSDEPWTDDVAIELQFSNPATRPEIRHRWPAIVDENQAVWDVSVDQVDALINDSARTALLVFRADGVPTLWGKGALRVLV